MPLFLKHQHARPCMPWGVVGAIGGAVVNNVMAPKGGGGGGSSQQSSSEPWAMAQPWMLQNIAQGMGQQAALTAQPFSPQQQAAYDNSYALNDYMRDLVPGLLGQLGGQQVGFDPKNRDARPQAWNWSGLLSDNAPDLGQKSVLSAKPQTAGGGGGQQGPSGNFVQQTGIIIPPGDGTQGLGTGGYGSFRYGMEIPAPGTQAYRDMSEYLAMGGADPYGFYGPNGQKKYVPPGTNPNAYLWTSGGSGGGAGGGIGDTGANAAASASGNTAW